MISSDDLYLTKLRSAKLSNTTARYAVFIALKESEHKPLSMSELVALTRHYADRASVYRSVKLLEQIGIIQRQNIGWKYKLELGEDFHGHHHHLTCNSCGSTIVTDENEEFEMMLAKISADNGYKITDHQLDIRGTCSNCQKHNEA